MKKLNRKLEYALMALKHMSHKMPGQLTTAKEVADSYRTPFDVTARVMQIMANNGVLKSEQGVSGGYQITKDLAKLNLHDLLNIIEGPTELVKCIHKQGAKPSEPACEIEKSCNIISPLQTLNSKLNEFYKSLTIKEILFKGNAQVPSLKQNLASTETRAEL